MPDRTLQGLPTAPLQRCCASGYDMATAIRPAPAPVSGTFDLIDDQGRPVNERSHGERLLLLFFGFTHCAVVCPRELAKLGRAVERLGPLAARLQLLYVSVDPRRDDPATLRRYLAQYPGGFVGLTGSTGQIDAAKKSFRVFAEPVTDPTAPGGYVVPHTAIAYLVAPGGRYLDHYADSLDAEAVARRLRGHLLDHPGAGPAPVQEPRP